MFKTLFLLYLSLILTNCTSPNTKWVIDMGEKPTVNPEQQMPPQNFNPEMSDPNYDFYRKKNQAPNIKEIYYNNPNLNQQIEKKPEIIEKPAPAPIVVEKAPVEEKKVEEKPSPLSKEKKFTDNNSLERIKYNNAEILDEKEIQNKKLDKNGIKQDIIYSGFYIQLGYFKDQSNAKNHLKNFMDKFKKSFPKMSIKITKIDDRYIILAGTYKKEEEAKKALKEIRVNSLFNDAFVVRK